MEGVAKRGESMRNWFTIAEGFSMMRRRRRKIELVGRVADNEAIKSVDGGWYPFWGRL